LFPLSDYLRPRGSHISEKGCQRDVELERRSVLERERGLTIIAMESKGARSGCESCKKSKVYKDQQTASNVALPCSDCEIKRGTIAYPTILSA
jgi:hypothetical protein